MTHDSYFSKKKSGGAFSSIGDTYQGFCTLYFTRKNIDNSEFLSTGIETDDDFTLLFSSHTKYFQVKYSTITHKIAKNYLKPYTTLIGLDIDKKLSTFITYLKQYKNFQSSDATEVDKIIKQCDFIKIMQKHNFSPDDLHIMKDNWNIESISIDHIEETIKYWIMDWGIQKGLLLDSGQAFSELLYIILIARNERGFLTKDRIISILKNHVISSFTKKTPDIKSGHFNRIKIDPDQVIKSVNNKISLAEDYLVKEKYQEALSEYLKLAEFVGSVSIYCRCAAIYSFLNNDTLALSWCEKALTLESLHPEALSIKGSLMLNANNVDLALELFLSANDKDSGNTSTLYQIGTCYAKKQKLEMAEEFYREAIAADENNIIARISLAYILYKIGLFTEASIHIDKALLQAPGMPDALACKGEITRFYGDSDEALRYFERCIKSQPENKEANLGKALCLLEKGDRKGILHLIYSCENELNSLPMGKSIVIVDLRWNDISIISITNYSQNKYHINYNGVEIITTKNGNKKIGIGIMRIGKTDTPIITQDYDNINDFTDTVTAFKAGVVFGDHVLVTGYVSEFSDFTEICITTKQHTIYGQTNRGKKEGFIAFRNAFSGFACMILTHKPSGQESVFCITGFELNTIT
ncbi:tetratricopeptide repeat protein [Xenorhabdus sp. PB61.4]|uniref:tetratricopeptide repeat protein n=1 Tax=Xenorhabdus sp. PB61.4 TaxID=2788940 RepID=UPI001E4049F7|nr:tetratricopeptide repeat protein [Xenorhabdus sp. PB61.4]MCC8367146.1 tetratricopeptide repeat protein [Xenorhabdus sp. PB61.4]